MVGAVVGGREFEEGEGIAGRALGGETLETGDKVVGLDVVVARPEVIDALLPVVAHDLLTKLSSTFLRPAFSNSMVSLLPSSESIRPYPNFKWNTLSPTV